MLWTLIGAAAAQRPILHSYVPIAPTAVLHGNDPATAIGCWSASDGSLFVHLRARRGHEVIASGAAVGVQEPAGGPILWTRTGEATTLTGRWVSFEGEPLMVDLDGGRRVPVADTLLPQARGGQTSFYLDTAQSQLGMVGQGGLSWLSIPPADDYTVAGTGGLDAVVLHSASRGAWMVFSGDGGALSLIFAHIDTDTEQIKAITHPAPLPNGKLGHTDVFTGAVLDAGSPPRADGLAVIKEVAGQQSISNVGTRLSGVR